MTSTIPHHTGAHLDRTPHLIVTVPGNGGRLEAVLRNAPGITAIRCDHDRLDIQVDDAQSLLHRIVGMARMSHIPIASVLVFPDAYEAGGLEAQLLTELHGDRGEGELP